MISSSAQKGMNPFSQGASPVVSYGNGSTATASFQGMEVIQAQEGTQLWQPDLEAFGGMQGGTGRKVNAKTDFFDL